MMNPNNGEILVMSAKEINKETGEVKDISTGNFLEAVEIGSTSKAGTLYTGFKENIIVPNTYFVDEPLWFKGSTKAKKQYGKRHREAFGLLMPIRRILQWPLQWLSHPK